MLILLVDDDGEDRDIFCEAVKAIDPGVKCFEMRDGLECLNALRETIVFPDFVFLDINMPIMNGEACLKEIRRERMFDDISVIMYSTTGNAEEIEKCKKLGATAFFVKPGSIHELIISLQSLFDVHRPRSRAAKRP